MPAIAVCSCVTIVLTDVSDGMCAVGGKRSLLTRLWDPGFPTALLCLVRACSLQPPPFFCAEGCSIMSPNDQFTQCQHPVKKTNPPEPKQSVAPLPCQKKTSTFIFCLCRSAYRLVGLIWFGGVKQAAGAYTPVAPEVLPRVHSALGVCGAVRVGSHCYHCCWTYGQCVPQEVWREGSPLVHLVANLCPPPPR